MYICVYMYIYTYTYIYTYIHICMYVYMYIEREREMRRHVARIANAGWVRASTKLAPAEPAGLPRPPRFCWGCAYIYMCVCVCVERERSIRVCV